MAFAVRERFAAQDARTDVPCYVAGLTAGGDRKSVQPMAARDGEVGTTSFHHFIASGVWDNSAN